MQKPGTGKVTGMSESQWGEQGLPGGSDGKESSCSMGELALIPGLGRSPEGGHGNPDKVTGKLWGQIGGGSPGRHLHFYFKEDGEPSEGSA